MLLIDVLTALVVALVLWAIFAHGFKRRGPWPGLLMFFALIFLGTWAGGVWLQPFGPVYWGVAVLPFVFIGLLLALLLAAVTPPPADEQSVTVEREEEPTVPEIAIGAFFWIFILMLLASLFARYVFLPPVA